MLPNWKPLLLGLSILLLSCPLQADDKPVTDANKKIEKGADLAIDLQTLRNEQASAFNSIREDLKTLSKSIKSQDELIALQGSDLIKMQREINDLKLQIKNLQDGMKYSQPRVARSVEPAPGTTGQIRIVNQLGTPVTMTLDNTRYFLQSGESRVLSNRPAGTINYQVEAPGFYTGIYSRSTQLDANQQLTILVGP